MTTALLGLSHSARATNASVPIQFDSPFLTRQLEKTVFGNQAGLSVWGDETGCNDLTLSKPLVTAENDRLYVITEAIAHTGVALGGSCVGLFNWHGKIKAEQRASVTDQSGMITFATVDSVLLNLDDTPAKTRNRIWKLVKDNVHPALAKLSIDLRPAVSEIRGMLPLFFDDQRLQQSQAMMASFHLSTLEVNAKGIVAVIKFNIATDQSDQTLPVAAKLTEAEIVKFTDVWERWDAFLTLLVKVGARNLLDDEQKEVLLDTLLEARYDLVEALSSSANRGADPVRRSFVKTWKQLAPVFKSIPLNSTQDSQGGASLRLFSFIAAADALAAIDALGPVTGWEVSSNGLRRLARLLISDSAVSQPSTAFELIPDQQVDQELRDLFEFGPGIKDPDASPAKNIDDSFEIQTVPDVDENGELQRGFDDDPIHNKDTISRSLSVSSKQPPGQLLSRPYNQPTSHSKALDWIVSQAYAQDSQSDPLVSLNQMVPTRRNLTDYLTRVRVLLHDVVDGTLWLKPLAPEYHTLYRNLVLTTAWQETCWRQYRQRNNKRHPMTSSAGALGMMQIMPRVWRGFYDIDSLGNSIVYNTTAGSEILHRYLTRYAIRKGEHQQPGGTSNLVRATYAAYNGGPGQLKRYRQNNTSKSLRAIDTGFWDKYQKVSEGDELAVRECYS